MCVRKCRILELGFELFWWLFLFFVNVGFLDVDLSVYGFLVEGGGGGGVVLSMFVV